MKTSLWVFFFGFALLTLGICGCDSTDSSVSPQPSQSTQSPGTNINLTIAGFSAQGYVSGATIIADKTKNGVNNYSLDGDESSAKTDDKGYFELKIDKNYGPFMLISKGGTDLITGKPAFTSVALPITLTTDSQGKITANQANITLLTTLAVINSDFKTLLEKIGVQIDTDISNPNGVPPNVLKLEKSLQMYLTALSSVDPAIVSDMSKQSEALLTFSKQLQASIALMFPDKKALETLTATDNLSMAIQGSINPALNNPKVTSLNLTPTQIQAISNTCVENFQNLSLQIENMNGAAVNESSLQDKLTTQINNLTSYISYNVLQIQNPVIKKVSIKEATSDNFNGKLINSGTVSLKTTAANSGTDLIYNIFLSFGAEKVFSEFTNSVTFTIMISDNNSSSTTRMILKNVKITVSAANDVSLDTGNAVFSFIGTNIKGDIVFSETDKSAQGYFLGEGAKLHIYWDNLKSLSMGGFTGFSTIGKYSITINSSLASFLQFNGIVEAK